jgi:hypothetical protein
MKLLFSIFTAAFYGLSIRLLFDIFDGPLAIMSISFFFLVPFLIGYLTILFLPYKESHSSLGAFFKPWLTCIVLLAITMYLNIEGSICWIMAFPLFAIVAGFGGVVAFKRKERRHRRNVTFDFEKDDWEKPGSLKMSFILLIPVLAAAIEGDRTSSFETLIVEKKMIVNTSPDSVWNALTENDRPAVKTNHTTLSGMLGFPHHLKTTIDTLRVGGCRLAVYEKGLTFTEKIKKLEPGRSLVIEITTDPSKISNAIMDEHIVIGGRHIKMQEDEYRLKALPDGQTLLTLSSRFCINTPFNWYAGIWAQWLMSDILKEELSSLPGITSSINLSSKIRQ